MKNLKVSAKLILGFLVVAILAGIVGATGIYGLSALQASGTSIFTDNTTSVFYVGKILESLQAQRVIMRDVCISTSRGADLSALKSEMQGHIDEMDLYFDEYEKTVDDVTAEKEFFDAKKLYEQHYLPSWDKLLAFAESGDAKGAVGVLDEARPDVNVMLQNFENSSEKNLAWAETASKDGQNLFLMLTIILAVLLLLAVAASIVLGLYNAAIIGKPLVKVKAVMEQIRETGSLDFPPDVKEQVRVEGLRRDEIGVFIGALAQMLDGIVANSELLGRIADGDLTVDVRPQSDQDTMGMALKKMVESLSSMFSQINEASAQVSTGAKQVADGAQALAQGSSEQAAAVEQLSASISGIAGKTRESAQQAEQAAALGGRIKINAEKSSAQMEQMMRSVQEINEASQSISKVIGVIDSIAFQTNILALNAAVEAARAGQHGKGFAVVADEVRSLAAKSAEAAKDTAILIANSIEKAEFGSRMALETSTSLNDIVTGIVESSTIVGDIAKSSEEQAVSIQQINKGIEQVAQVVQQNTATAEESAAASEQMSGQSALLQELVMQFKLAGTQRRLGGEYASRRELRLPQKPSVPYPAPETPAYGEFEGDFGKY